MSNIRPHWNVVGVIWAITEGVLEEWLPLGIFIRVVLDVASDSFESLGAHGVVLFVATTRSLASPQVPGPLWAVVR